MACIRFLVHLTLSSVVLFQVGQAKHVLAPLLCDLFPIVMFLDELRIRNICVFLTKFIDETAVLAIGETKPVSVLKLGPSDCQLQSQSGFYGQLNIFDDGFLGSVDSAALYDILAMYCGYYIVLGFTLIVTAMTNKLRRDASRIVNGVEVSHKEYPFIVSIEYHDDDMDEWSTTCGGSVINRVTILTACHCATADEKIHGNIKYMANPKERRVVAGTGCWKRRDVTRQIARVERIVTHPKCQNFYILDRNFVNDVALYFLKDPLVYGPQVQPIRLPSNDLLTAVDYLNNLKATGATCTTIGWGRTVESRSDQSETLIGAKVQVLRADQCRRRFCSMVSDHCQTDFDRFGQFCVASPVASDCFGDSGGPLICDGFVVGTVSYGDRCLPNLPTVYQGLGPIIEVLKIYRVLPDEPTSCKRDNLAYGGKLEPEQRPEPNRSEPIARELHVIHKLLEELLSKRSKK